MLRALGGEIDSILVESDAAENGPNAKRNWWASSRELVCVTIGRGTVVIGGIINEADLRGPRDVANL
jgi:ribonuclease P/MRP protein subunit RPP1